MYTDIDERYLDLDFTKQPHYVFGDLGVGLSKARFGVFEERESIMSPSEIEEAIDAMESGKSGCQWLVKYVLNQGQEGSCVGNATTAGDMIVQAIQYGLENVIQMSAISMYKQIGSGPNSGAMVSDALDKLQSVGFLPLNTTENKARFGDHVMPATGFYSKWPSGWMSTAALFKGYECDIIRSVAGIKTALCKQYPVIVGRQGHSVCYTTVMRGSRGQHVVPYINSWGEWGAALGHLPYGFGFDSESLISQSAQWAFAIRAVLAPPPHTTTRSRRGTVRKRRRK